jgi:hypothetical protein|tara:strand:+ start:489 stop:749 length:261 start_codon:yes stop_codon:yes gene_type:complete
MRLKIILGANKSITLEHLEEELYEVIELERCHLEAIVGDRVMKTDVGWVTFRDKNCALPRYRIPSQAVKDIQFLDAYALTEVGEEE